MKTLGEIRETTRGIGWMCPHCLTEIGDDVEVYSDEIGAEVGCPNVQCNQALSLDELASRPDEILAALREELHVATILLGAERRLTARLMADARRAEPHELIHATEQRILAEVRQLDAERELERVDAARRLMRDPVMRLRVSGAAEALSGAEGDALRQVLAALIPERPVLRLVPNEVQHG